MIIRSIFTRESQSGLSAVFLICLSVLLMVMDRRLESFASIRAALALPLVPLEYVVSLPAQFIGDLESIITTHDNLVNENLRLKTNELLLKAQLQRLIAIESENNYLKALLQSSHQIKGKTLIAEIMAIDGDPFMNQVVLNKGSHDGLYIGQPVLDANGVMGQIIQVGPLTSRVLLINDTRSGVSVQNGRNGTRAVAVGDGYSGKLRLIYIAKTADIRVGDMFLTSELSNHYPEGYPVGKVVDLVKDPAHQFANIYLQPSAHLDSSRQVLLVWYQHE